MAAPTRIYCREQIRYPLARRPPLPLMSTLRLGLERMGLGHLTIQRLLQPLARADRQSAIDQLMALTRIQTETAIQPTTVPQPAFPCSTIRVGAVPSFW